MTGRGHEEGGVEALQEVREQQRERSGYYGMQ